MTNPVLFWTLVCLDVVAITCLVIHYYRMGKRRGHDEGYHEGYMKGCDEGLRMFRNEKMKEAE